MQIRSWPRSASGSQLAVLACLMLASARAGAQPADRSVAFRFNSAQGIFSIQGSYEGSYTVEPDHVELRLDQVDIFAGERMAATAHEMVAGVEFGLATPINDKGGWDIKRRAREIPVGKVFGPTSRMSLGPQTLSIPIDNTMNLARHWIVVSILGPRLPAPDNRPSVMWHAHSAFDIFNQVNIPLAPPPAQAPNPAPPASTPAQAPPAQAPPVQAPPPQAPPQAPPAQAPAPPAEAPAPPAQAPAPPAVGNGEQGVFRFNSEGGIFAVQGNFAGLLSVRPDRVSLALEEADIFLGRQMHFTTRRRIGSVTFGLAAAIDGKPWDIVRVGSAFQVNQVLTPGGNIRLGHQLVTIPIDDKLDLSKCWIVVKIDDTALNLGVAKQTQGHALVHSARGLFAAAH